MNKPLKRKHMLSLQQIADLKVGETFTDVEGKVYTKTEPAIEDPAEDTTWKLDSTKKTD